MRKTVIISALIIFWGIHLRAQNFTIKPYFGYTTVRMADANNDTKVRIENLRRITGQPLSFPDAFKGDYTWGAQIEYHMEENYFFNLNTSYFREKNTANNTTTVSASPFTYHTDRQIELFEISVGLHYYINYSSWKRVNTYLGGGFGLGLGWFQSNLKFNDKDNRVNNSADFSSNALTAHICGGATVRLSTWLFLSGEAGIRFANLQQMDGQLRVDEDVDNVVRKTIENNYVTDAVYDFTGFYFTLGTGFMLPFFK